MPADPRFYRQIAMAQFEDAFGKDLTLLDACMWLHHSSTGTGGILPPEVVDKMKAALRARLDAWTPSALPRSAGFDEAVRRLVVAALAEAEQSA
jgi:hypothetical protein